MTIFDDMPGRSPSCRRAPLTSATTWGGVRGDISLDSGPPGKDLSFDVCWVEVGLQVRPGHRPEDCHLPQPVELRGGVRSEFQCLGLVGLVHKSLMSYLEVRSAFRFGQDSDLKLGYLFSLYNHLWSS